MSFAQNDWDKKLDEEKKLNSEKIREIQDSHETKLKTNR